MIISNKDYLESYNLALYRRKKTLFDNFSALRYIRTSKEGTEDGLLRWVIILVKLLNDNIKNYHMQPGISTRIRKLMNVVEVHPSIIELYRKAEEKMEKIWLFFNGSLYDFLAEKNIAITIAFYHVYEYYNTKAKFLLHISEEKFLEFDLEYFSNRMYYGNGRNFTTQNELSSYILYEVKKATGVK